MVKLRAYAWAHLSKDGASAYLLSRQRGRPVLTRSTLPSRPSPVGHASLARFALPMKLGPYRVQLRGIAQQLLAAGDRGNPDACRARHMLLKLDLLPWRRVGHLEPHPLRTPRNPRGIASIGNEILVHRMGNAIDIGPGLGPAPLCITHERLWLVGHDSIREDDLTNLDLSPKARGDAEQEEGLGLVALDELGRRGRRARISRHPDAADHHRQRTAAESGRDLAVVVDSSELVLAATPLWNAERRQSRMELRRNHGQYRYVGLPLRHGQG